jgi:hypothetical protein
MACNCIEEMDAKLAEHNTRIAVTFAFPRDGSPSYVLPTIAVEKIDRKKRGSTALAFPTYCPFCGTQYEADPAVNLLDEVRAREGAAS